MKKKMQTLFTITLLTIAWLATLPQVNAILWSGDMQFTTAMTYDECPAMTETKDKKIWMFWQSDPSANWDIYYNYTSEGTTWSKAFRLTTHPSMDSNPAVVTTREGKMWVFWTTDRDKNPDVPYNYNIYFKTSSNNGASWSSDTQFTYNVQADQCPSVMQAHNGHIWVVWYTNRDGNNELYYNTYDGAWWGLEHRLTNNVNHDVDPSIIQDDTGKIWVFWSRYITVDESALYYKTSINYGANWSTETQLTFPANNILDLYPSAIQTQDGTIWVVWMKGALNKDFDLYYKTYNGFTWSANTATVTDGDDDLHPTIFQAANTTMWIAWTSTRFEDYDIFYKATLTEHDIAIRSVTPTENAYKGYQSPIKVAVKNCGMYTETFNVTAYYGLNPIGTEMVTDLAPNAVSTLIFTWNTTDVPFGSYINLWSANASKVPGEADFTDNYLTNGTVLMTIPGDVNGDRTVNILDKGKISAHWYPGPPIGSLGYAEVADINYDEAVDVVDVAIVSANWEKSW